METVVDPNEGIDQLSKRLRTLMSHFSRESHSKSVSGHPDWFDQICRMKDVLSGKEAEDLTLEPTAAETEPPQPKGKARSKAGKAGKAKAAVPKPLAKATSSGLRRLASSSALDVNQLSGPPAKRPAVEVSFEPTARPFVSIDSSADRPRPLLVRSKAAPPSQCVQIPASRFPIYFSSDTESESEDRASAIRDDEQALVTPETKPRPVASSQHAPSPLPLAETATETSSKQTVFPKAGQYKTGFQNRRGAWIKLKEEWVENMKQKHFTSVMEVQDNEVWGTWDLKSKFLKAPIIDLKPDEIAGALQSIAEKYQKGKKHSGLERPIIYKGTMCKLEGFQSLTPFR